MRQIPNQHNRPTSESEISGTDPNSAPKYRYRDLNPSGTEVLIEYEGQIYRLRTTRNGKLILNK